MTDDYQHILQPFRDQIDALDDQITDLLQTREQVIRSVATLKKEQEIPAILPERVEEVITRCAARAKEQGSDGEYVYKIYEMIVAQSCALENKLIASDDQGNDNE